MAPWHAIGRSSGSVGRRPVRFVALVPLVVAVCGGQPTAPGQPEVNQATEPAPIPSEHVVAGSAPVVLATPLASPSPSAANSPDAIVWSSIDVAGTTAGMPITARLDLTSPNGPVGGATVIVTVEDPSGISRSFRLFDDGGHADGYAADGIYGAELWATDLPGSYTIRAVATGTDAGGNQFAREEAASVVLAEKVDRDGDGVADAAESRYGLDPADPGDANTDFDLDGLGVREELAAGSHPYLADSDGGGEPDGGEVSAGRNPMDPTDDHDPLSPFVGVTPQDGNLLALAVGTKEGTGMVEVSRFDGTATTPLGTYPGSGASIVDGPLPTGEYWYLVTSVSADGTRSSTEAAGPFHAGPDVTAPIVKITINGGAWTTSNRTVSVVLETSKPVTSMRFAESEAGLASAPWQPFEASTTFRVGPEPGFHAVYVEVRDAAGQVSLRPDNGIVDLASP